MRCGGGWKPAHGSDIEALPTETGSNKLGRAYGAMAPVLDPTSRGCVCGAVDAWVRGRAASSTSLRLRRYCTLANPGLDARVLQQAATSNIQSRTSKTRLVWMSSKLQCAPAPLYETGMHTHCPAVPWMPRIADFADVSNMGVVLLSCSTPREITRAKAT